MDLFDIIMLSFIAIVGFAAVSSNIKEKMEERGKESGKEKELKKNIILCALIFMAASVALPILLWYIGFSKQGVGAVIATFVLVDFVFLFSLIGVFDKTAPEESDNPIKNTIPEVQYSQQAGEIHFTFAELEEILLVVKNDTSCEKIPGSQEYLISVLQQKIEEQKEIEKQNKKKQAMLMNSAACASYVISHMR